MGLRFLSSDYCMKSQIKSAGSNYEANGVSVIICCFNSAKVLPETIARIAAQKTMPDLCWEVIVVNNNSSDNTVDVVRKIADSTGISERLNVVNEPQQGLINARIAGVNRAKYSTIIFCDDDNWLDENYIQSAHSIMNENAEIGALGGKGNVQPEGELPHWWNKYSAGYAVGIQADHSGDVSDRRYLWGAGLVTRKKLLAKVFDKNFSFLLSDRKGGQLSSGGDAEICVRILLLGYKLYYDDSLKFTHYITSQRLTDLYREKLFQSFVHSSTTLQPYYLVLKFSSLADTYFVKRVYRSVKFMLKWLINGDPKERYFNGMRLNCIWRKNFFKIESPYKEVFRFYQYGRRGSTNS